jgi:hypothetical protein
MVSSVLHLSSAELVAKLAHFRDAYADDPEYQELRQQFPAEWPM